MIKVIFISGDAVIHSRRAHLLVTPAVMGRPALGRAAVRPAEESLLALLALEAQLELMELLLLGGPLLQPRLVAEEAMQLAANVGGARAVAILQTPALRVLANAQHGVILE